MHNARVYLNLYHVPIHFNLYVFAARRGKAFRLYRHCVYRKPNCRLLSFTKKPNITLMQNLMQASKCCCNVQQPEAPPPPWLKAKRTARSALSMLLSIIIAFFPKCPFCWAIYMSMFGCLGIAKLPYMKWLLPVLLLFLALHLFMLYRKAARIGYIPFGISVFGAVTIMFTRTFFPFETWLLIIGMVSIISGSLLNSFTNNRLKFKTQQIH